MLNKQALQRCIDGTAAERLYLTERDFSLFFTYYYIDYIKYDFAPFHYDMFQDVMDAYNGTYREIAWFIFRESAKTSFAKAILSWTICFKKRKYLNADSFDKENAERTLFDTVLELQTNPRIIGDFGQLYNSKRSMSEVSQKRVSNFVTNNGIRVEAHSTQESVRGRLHVNQRPDWLLLDDFETVKTKESKAYTKQVIDHINEFKAGLDSTALVFYLGNRISEYGSVQTLIDRAKTDNRLLVRNVPVIANNEIMWGAKYTMTDAEAAGTNKVSLEDKKRSLGTQVFNSEMMNLPIDDTTAEFKKEWLKTITDSDVKRMNTRNFGTIDPAYSQKDSADQIGITINHVNRENRWHLRCFGTRQTPKELIETMFNLYERHHLECWGVEEGVFDLVIKEFLDDEMRKRNKFMTIIKLKHSGTNKQTRIRGLLPRYESGSVYHIDHEAVDLEEQLRTFPTGQLDDCLDSAGYQIQIAKPPYEEQQIEEEVAPMYPDIGI